MRRIVFLDTTYQCYQTIKLVFQSNSSSEVGTTKSSETKKIKTCHEKTKKVIQMPWEKLALNEAKIVRALVPPLVGGLLKFCWKLLESPSWGHDNRIQPDSKIALRSCKRNPQVSQVTCGGQWTQCIILSTSHLLAKIPNDLNRTLWVIQNRRTKKLNHC